ncbi:MAG: 3'-5' exonuclease [Campylobacterota bacterium]|nr:3'-5' exonuclease [Campylobacterota bacterium]
MSIIKTLATDTYAVVTQIGACYFDRNTGEIGDELLVNIQIQDCLNHGLRVDAGAIKFWFEQSRQTFLENPVPLTKAAQQLREFYKKEVLVWAHATFDFPRLAEAYEKIGQGFCFPYRKLRDIRTLVDLSNVPYKKIPKDESQTHDALYDCKFQVKYCYECFKELNKRR